jgi:hypothetical protein
MALSLEPHPQLFFALYIFHVFVPADLAPQSSYHASQIAGCTGVYHCGWLMPALPSNHSHDLHLLSSWGYTGESANAGLQLGFILIY